MNVTEILNLSDEQLIQIGILEEVDHPVVTRISSTKIRIDSLNSRKWDGNYIDIEKNDDYGDYYSVGIRTDCGDTSAMMSYKVYKYLVSLGIEID